MFNCSAAAAASAAASASTQLRFDLARLLGDFYTILTYLAMSFTHSAATQVLPPTSSPWLAGYRLGLRLSPATFAWHFLGNCFSFFFG